MRFNGWPLGIGDDQLSISFQSGTSLDAAVSTSSPVYPVWPWAPGTTQRCFSSVGAAKNSLQHRVRRVEQVLRQVVRRVDEAGLQAPPHAVDDRPPLLAAPPLERQQVDVEDLAHELALTLTWRARRERRRPGARRCGGTRPRCPAASGRSTALPSSPAKPLPL